MGKTQLEACAGVGGDEDKDALAVGEFACDGQAQAGAPAVAGAGVDEPDEEFETRSAFSAGTPDPAPWTDRMTCWSWFRTVTWTQLVAWRVALSTRLRCARRRVWWRPW